MIVGNQESIKLLNSCIDNFLDNKENKHSFFILSWPQSIGKSTIVEDLFRDRLGQYFFNDFLHIRDLSAKLGKRHNLKIETPKDKEDRVIDLWDWKVYEDIGIREINHWLQQSSFSKYKVVFIENIERIVPSAANAFLKTCEEPLPGRIIIATTSHQSQLLDTIISRWLVIRFQELSHNDLIRFADENNIRNDDKEFQIFACNMAMGRPGVLLHLHKVLSEDNELKNNFEKLVKLLSKDWYIFQKQDILKKLHEAGSLNNFLDWRISYCANNDLVDQSAKWLEVKKMMNSNVNIDNILLGAVL